MLLSTPLNVLVLEALFDGPKQHADLRRAGGSPAQSTLRTQLNRLVELDVIEKTRRNRFPSVLEYELTESGRDLRVVMAILGRWLERAPEEPLSLGGNPARAAIKALAEGWSTTIPRALAAGPRSLTELNRVINVLSYPSLERRLSAMRYASLIEPQPNNDRGTPYRITDWLREGVAPLAGAARWEHRHLPEAAPIGRLDTEAAFLLAVPLLTLSADLSGSCRMAAEISSGHIQRLAGVVVRLAKGRVRSCVTTLQGHPDAWALGPPGAWLDAVMEPDPSRLELGGDQRVARQLIEGLHGVLFTKSSKNGLTSPI